MTSEGVARVPLFEPCLKVKLLVKCRGSLLVIYYLQDTYGLKSRRRPFESELTTAAAVGVILIKLQAVIPDRWR